MKVVADVLGGAGGVLSMGVAVRVGFQKGGDGVSHAGGFGGRCLLRRRYSTHFLCGLLG